MKGVNAFRIRRRPILVGLAAVVVLLSLGVPGTGSAVAGPAPGSGRASTVTLLTGDVVTVYPTATGCPQVSVRPAEPNGVLNRSCGPDGHVRVVPARVAPQVGKTLDPALFDVTALIRDGYDDAHTAELPLIVQGAATSLARSHALPSIGAMAGRHPKGASFAALRSSGKIWLDRRVHATVTLDRNLRQIDAPAAWASGDTGKGTRVAVLDTGVDPTHPDLVGQVAERMDFTVDGGDAVDHFGHGTHVAATIAGTGAASGGARKGVAPGAKLVVGKVLDDEGFGTDSQIIAGMEWAAPRADVVNLSLGGFEPSDGTDPLSLAVDALTKQTGALFVVAAGNDGPADGLIAAPAAAASALTVGAVDGTDTLAEFSSRGPLVNTRAAKPELVAPGVDIVAARAAGTTMGRAIDANYTAASGTSMATPHVAGAAALLAARHPDWRAEQLKAALVGAADPVRGDAYAIGAGRLNAARALTGVVSGQSVVNLSGSDAKLTWINTSVHPATLTLEVSSAVVSLSGAEVRLAPGASGGVTLRVDRTALAAGLYLAVVTARSGGTVVARTPVAFYVEPPSYDLTIETTKIPGAPDGALGYVGVQVVNLDDPAIFAQGVYGDPGDTLTVRVPAGRYSVMGSTMTWAGDDQRAALAGDPDLTIGADTTVRLDLTAAKPLKASVDGVNTSASSVGLTYIQSGRRGPAWDDFAFAWGTGAVLVAPNSGAGVGSFRAYAAFSLNAPGALYDLVRPFGNGIPADPTYRVTPAEHARLARIDQHFSRLDQPGSVTGHKRYGYSPEGVFIAENSTGDLVGDRTDYVTPGMPWTDEAFWDEVVTQESKHTYAPGSRQSKTWVRQPLRSDWYDDPVQSSSGCAPYPPSRTSGNLHIELVTLADQHQRFDCLGGGFLLDIKHRLALSRNGTPVGEVDNTWADFTIPREAATYRLTYDIDTSASLSLSTRVSTAWTFRSTGPRGTGSVPLPLLSVDYALPLDTANHPTGAGPALFTVRQAVGVQRQAITSFELSVSVDDGVTWQPVRVSRAGDGTFRAQLPTAAGGRAVSLRVKAQGSAGSAVEQTIIRAYRAPA